MSLLNYEETGKYDLSFKIVIIGDSGVGKSCLINRAAKGKFTSDYSPTLGFEFVSFTIKIEEKKTTNVGYMWSGSLSVFNY